MVHVSVSGQILGSSGGSPITHVMKLTFFICLSEDASVKIGMVEAAIIDPEQQIVGLVEVVKLIGAMFISVLAVLTCRSQHQMSRYAFLQQVWSKKVWVRTVRRFFKIWQSELSLNRLRVSSRDRLSVSLIRQHICTQENVLDRVWERGTRMRLLSESWARGFGSPFLTRC